MRCVDILLPRGGDMQLPAPILEHPIESIIAGLLLAMLLFVSAGQDPAANQASQPVQTAAQKM